MKPDAKQTNRYWGSRELPKSKADFFNAVTMPAPVGEGTVATVRMYGPIDSWGGWWGVSAKDVGDVLDALPESVTQIILRINSPGGEVFEAVSILNLLRAHRASVLAVVDGLAASAASFIAAGCDETVMSPGTQMMIHSPWTITWGNSRDLRKEADFLDKLETSIVELYTAKAGEKDWSSLLAEDTWLTAAEAVELGLADRVAVIPDAGETETVGADEEITLITVTDPEGDDADDSYARVVHLHGKAAAAVLHRLPSSSEPGDPNREENAVAYSDLTAGLRERLGVSDANASDEQLLAAVDERLAAPTKSITEAPEGTVLMDAAQLEALRVAAEDGRQARAQQARERRERAVASAVEEGRIAPSSSSTWLAALEANEDSTTALLNSLAKNTIPVAEIGRSDEPNAEDSLYAQAWGTDDQKGA